MRHGKKVDNQLCNVMHASVLNIAQLLYFYVEPSHQGGPVSVIPVRMTKSHRHDLRKDEILPQPQIVVCTFWLYSSLAN